MEDEEPLIRGHTARAMGRIRTEEAVGGLHGRIALEAEGWVREEVFENPS
jgi:hypothetical protein